MNKTQIFKLDENDFRVYSMTKREIRDPSNPLDPSYIKDKKEELKCLMTRFHESSH
jgi:hypothetical protein